MQKSNFNTSTTKLSVQELSNLNYTWDNHKQGEIFELEGMGSYRLAKVINDLGYDAAVVEKLNANGLVTDAAFLNHGADGIFDKLEVIAINSGLHSSQAIKAAEHYQIASKTYSDFTLKLSGHSMGGGLANYTLAKIISDGGNIPETFTFASINAEKLINKYFGDSVDLSGLTSNFIATNDYYFGKDGAYSNPFINLTKNVSGNGFADNYILPHWDDGRGDSHNSHNKIFVDISNSNELTGYDNLKIEIRGSSAGTTLIGNSTDNTIYGNDGDDNIIGLGGADLLWGGKGKDVYTYLNLNDSITQSPDTIKDFVSGEDIINISEITKNFDNSNFVEEFNKNPGEIKLSFYSTENKSILSFDATGDGNSDFSVNIIGQVLTTDIII